MINDRPTTIDEYVHLVDRAINEVDELILKLEDDTDDQSEQLQLLNALSESLFTVLGSMADGSYENQDSEKDLPFMEVANKLTDQQPIVHLLAVINDTHRNGLDDEG
jgi:hypothetical protein